MRGSLERVYNVPEGGGEGKSLACERGSVRDERFCVIINRIVSTLHRKRTPDDCEEAFI